MAAAAGATIVSLKIYAKAVINVHLKNARVSVANAVCAVGEDRI
jgi:hypothetical protein